MGSLLTVVAFGALTFADPFAMEARAATIFRDAPAWILAFATILHVVGGTAAGLILAGAACALLARAGHRAEAGVLAAGTLGTLLASGALKVIVARERPEEALLQLADGAYPSGHAARAALFACAVATFARRFKMTHAWLVALAGAVYMVAMGLSRLVLGVHRAYDVLGGWALGVAVWMACAGLLARAQRR